MHLCAHMCTFHWLNCNKNCGKGGNNMPTQLALLKQRLGATDFKLAQKILIPRGTRVVRPLPMPTPIKNMGLPRPVFNKLSPAAKRLTKGDLVALWQDTTTTRAKRITLQDLNVIRDGFSSQVGKGPPGSLAMDIYCCCCPCCCATAVVQPAAEVA